MAEQESVLGLISQNIVDTLNGIIVPYSLNDALAEEDHEMYSDFQRTEDYFHVYPFSVVSFAGSRLLNNSSRSSFREAKYEIFCYVGDINDEWNPDPDIAIEDQIRPISKTLKNLPAYLEKALVEEENQSITRGGNASNTWVGDIDQFFVPAIGNESVTFITYLEVFVQYFTSQFDPFTRVG